MLFNSFKFMLFLPVVFCLYWIIPNKVRWVLLLISSYYFYMSWNVKYVFLILATTIISYVCGILLKRTDEIKKKRVILGVSIVICIGILFVFKYFNFFMNTINEVCSLFAISLHPMTLKIVLPMGISFYTFQTIGYVIDVYRGGGMRRA